MKTSKKKISDEESDNFGENTLDPFAKDFFGVEDNSAVFETDDHEIRSKKTTEIKLSKIPKGLDWARNLPKISINEAEFSNQILEFPDKLSENLDGSLKRSLSKLTNTKEYQIASEILFIGEVNLSESLNELHKNSSIFLNINFQTKVENALIAINSEFMTALIDLLLGGKGKNAETMRRLSAIETAIFEFLVLDILNEFNQNSENNKLSLQGIINEISDYDQFQRGAEVVCEINCGEVGGNITILLPNELLKSLDKSFYKQNTVKEKFKKFNQLVKNLDLKIPFGETRINASDLPFLEKNDVVLIEKPLQIWQNGVTKNTIQAFIGDSTNFYLKGNWQIEPTLNETDILSAEILLEVEEIVSDKDKRFQFNRKKMDTKKAMTTETITDEAENNIEEIAETENSEESTSVQNEFDEQDAEENLATLENVMVNLRVSLGGRRLSLGELQKIRVGQIIELGCRPNDPVEIITDNDNKPIATGELCEIEGQLGVRLTKIFV